MDCPSEPGRVPSRSGRVWGRLSGRVKSPEIVDRAGWADCPCTYTRERGRKKKREGEVRGNPADPARHRTRGVFDPTQSARQSARHTPWATRWVRVLAGRRNRYVGMRSTRAGQQRGPVLTPVPGSTAGGLGHSIAQACLRTAAEHPRRPP